MIVKETNKFLRKIKCPFCGYVYKESETTEPLGNTDFIKKKCRGCRNTFYWKRQTTTEYIMATED